MKSSEIKKLIKEEVVFQQIEAVDLFIIETYHNFINKFTLNESMLASLIAFFLEKKYRKKAEKLKNSPEYKDLLLQMKVSADSLNAVTDRLKKAIDKKEALEAEARSMGIQIKPFSSIDDLKAQFNSARMEQNPYKNKLEKHKMKNKK